MQYDSLFRHSIEQPEEFWQKQAEKVAWTHKPDSVLTTDHEQLYRWFEGGKLNTCYLALDKHVNEGRGNQVAICYDSPFTQSSQQYTYSEVLEHTRRTAGMLAKLGVHKGDRVIIYMPMIPQTLFAMLACARLGAVHSVVFGGFAAHELALRIDDAKPKVILTASAGVEFEKVIPYMPIIQQAIDEAHHKVHDVVVYQRWFSKTDITPTHVHDWDDLLSHAPSVDCVPVHAHDPLYILYTSGTTGKPKGIVRDNGGHAVALQYSMEYVYGAKQGDVFWAASDVGWVVGHSYIVYAPLMVGCTTIMYEGKPVRTPDAGAFWRLIEQYKVNILFTAPTAIRAIKKEDPDALLLAKYDISSLRQLFLAGERCDVATLDWATTHLKRPVLDHWWQTESGWPMLANPVGLGLFPIKPGSAGKPVPGFHIQILDQDGQEVTDGQEGAVAIKLPLPPGCLPTLWQASDRFKESYLDAFPGYYFTGDGGFKDDDGYVFITGRIDDVINVSGHRLSTADMEEIVASHPAVAECAVIGVEHPLKGQVPVGLVITKAGIEVDPELLQAQLVRLVRDKLGALACFKKAYLVKRLPKTRSGKILRKVMRNIADQKSFQAPSTIEDITVLDDFQVLFDEKRVEMQE